MSNNHFCQLIMKNLLFCSRSKTKSIDSSRKSNRSRRRALRSQLPARPKKPVGCWVSLISSVVERRASDQMAADYGFDSRTDNASLCSQERHFSFILHWGQAVCRLFRSLTKDLQTERKKCCALARLGRRNLPGSYERTSHPVACSVIPVHRGCSSLRVVWLTSVAAHPAGCDRLPRFPSAEASCLAMMYQFFTFCEGGAENKMKNKQKRKLLQHCCFATLISCFF